MLLSWKFQPKIPFGLLEKNKSFFLMPKTLWSVGFNVDRIKAILHRIMPLISAYLIVVMKISFSRSAISQDIPLCSLSKEPVYYISSVKLKTLDFHI